MKCFASVTLSWLVMVLFLSGTEAQNKCPNDWLFYNNYCYKYFDKHLTWSDAEIYCRDQMMGAHLASIHDWAESFQLYKYLSNHAQVHLFIRDHVWIGLGDPQKRRIWRWSDGSSFNYTSWNQGEPNNLFYSEYCVELWANSRYIKWNDKNCKSWQSFLCKYPLPQLEGSTW
uniref:Lectin-Cyl-2 n=1 Tax=Cylindrophis ruffus TaxID=186578 RepID=M9T298_CYLRU